MPEFPENTGFKLPGLGAREVNTPGNFREDSSACAGTPKGTSPLLAIDLDAIVPQYYKTSYTKTNWPTFRRKSKGKSECSDGMSKDAETGECIKSKDLDTKVDTETTGGEKTNVRKTWKQAWADNDENIQDKYKSYSDYEADRSGQKKKDPEGYEKDLVQKTGVAGGPGQSTTKDESKTTSEYEVNGKSATKEEYCAARPDDSRCSK